MRFYIFISILALLTSRSHSKELLEGIAATVNNEIVSFSDLEKAKIKFEKNIGVDDLLLFGRQPSEIAKDKKTILDFLISESLIDSEVRRLNLTVTVERVEQELRDIAKRNNMSRAELNQAVKAQGSGVAEYQDYLKTRLERQNLIVQEVTSKIRVTDEDVLAAYTKKFPNQTTGSFEYSLAHIQFNTKKGGEKSAMERAQKVLDRLRSGESFDALAEQITEDPNFSPGGTLGSFKAGEFSKEFESAVAKLSPGETSGVVPGRGTFHILKLVSKKVISDPFYDKQKDGLRNTLFEETFQKHFRLWIEQKREDAFIRINI